MFLVVTSTISSLFNLLEAPANTHDEYYRQKSLTNSHNMVKVCIDALSNYPNPQEVVLMEWTPRYDALNELKVYANLLMHGWESQPGVRGWDEGVLLRFRRVLS